MTTSIDTRLEELGITLPRPNPPVANYVPVVITGSYAYVSGQLPLDASGLTLGGQLGDGVSIEDAQDAARLCAVNVLAQLNAALGGFDRVVRLVKLVGFVASVPSFGDQPKVVNGASDFFVEVMGDAGRHARSAVGVAALPFGAAVEVEAIFEIA